MSDFVHLHVHSEYSLLDGLPHPKDLAKRAAELQQPALALTDHGALFAAIEFYDACKAEKIKPIIGVEMYLAKHSMKDRDAKEDRNSHHLLLLAENNVGYQNLLRLASAAQLEGFYYYPRVDRDLLAQHSAGLICTTGCPSGQVPRLLAEGRVEDARRALGWFRDVFQDRFYVELQEHAIGEFANLNKDLIALAREFNLPLVATNDAHYLRPEDAGAQDILLCIQTNTVVTDSKRMRMDGNDYYLKSSDEMRALWRDVPEALSNTLLVAERCNVDLDFKEYHLPKFPVPDGFNAETYLRHLCEQGFRKYYPNGNPAARERLDYELGVIHAMGFDTYFLIVWDLLRAARERTIWFNVRGSAAGSMAAYCAGITNLDPIQHRLIFERFLNPGRISMPDIDLDFQDDRRAELIEYTVQKYGKDNVAQIVTFGTLAAKASIRDVGRALDYPLSEVDRVAKLLPTGPNVKLDDCLEKIPDFKQAYEESDYVRKLIDHARLLEGVARNAGTHAAGVVVADKPIVEYAPLHRPTKGDNPGGFPIVQYEMNWLERVGLLKMDYLGLASLTIMRRACELIKARHGVEFGLGNIPVDDPKAFDLLARGDVTGVFQVEGSGMRQVLTRMKPQRFEHIVATISLYRPGPMEYIPNYINRLHGVEKVQYRHPALKPILAETYAIMVYQEQIIQIAMELAGYTASEADLLRRAVGKKDKEKLLKERDRFVERAEKHGIITREIAEQIFDDVEFFARYGFNKAHAANYAVLTCQTAFLKAHYPLEYTTALLMTELGNVEKVGQLVSETRRKGIEILPPNLNASDVNFTITPDSQGIYFALSAIKNVGVGAVEVIVNARQKAGAFKSLDDFCRRVDLRSVNRRALESLIKAGAMDQFGRRSQLLKVLDRMMAASQAAHQASDRGQLSMFGAAPSPASGGGLGWGGADTFGTLPDEPEVPNRDKLADEKELTGAYFSDNPLMRLAKNSSNRVTHFANQLDESLARQTITLAGVVTSVRVITTKKGDPMAFVSLEDPSGATEITIFPKTFERTRELWRNDALLLVKGKVELRDGKIQVLCDSAEEYQIPTDDATQPSAVSDQRSAVGGQPSAVQYAMPDEAEAALAEIDPFAGDAFEPEISNQRSAVSHPPSAVSDQPSAVNGQPSAVGGRNGGNGVMYAPPAEPARVMEAAARYQAARHLRIFLARSNDYDEDLRRMRELLALLASADGRDRFTFYVPNPQGVVQLDFPNHSTSYAQVQSSLDEMLGGWGTLEVQ
ncbi:MAG: DNA polymerase III subunit alpha [Chloroflexi bacterium]|nr:DNA polymerase III subunit alpha [Chloroflexota bacterium]